MPDGGSRCQALPGCRPALELCMEDKECCSGRCAPSPTGGPGRCERAPGCQPEQERCATGATCCSGVCNVPPEGVGRCAKPSRGTADHCRVVGELCMKADECCDGETCRADSTVRPDRRGLRGVRRLLQRLVRGIAGSHGVRDRARRARRSRLRQPR